MPKKTTNEYGLTPLQQGFIDRYLSNGSNGTVAYLLCKPMVSRETAQVEASKILKNSNIKKYLELKRQELANKENIELSYLVNHLKNIIYEVASEGTERDDNGRITSKPDRMAAIAAIDKLAKLAGYYEKKPAINIQSTGEVNISFGDWSPTETQAIESKPSTPMIDVSFTEEKEGEEDNG